METFIKNRANESINTLIERGVHDRKQIMYEHVTISDKTFSDPLDIQEFNAFLDTAVAVNEDNWKMIVELLKIYGWASNLNLDGASHLCERAKLMWDLIEQPIDYETNRLQIYSPVMPTTLKIDDDNYLKKRFIQQYIDKLQTQYKTLTSDGFPELTQYIDPPFQKALTEIVEERMPFDEKLQKLNELMNNQFRPMVHMRIVYS